MKLRNNLLLLLLVLAGCAIFQSRPSTEDSLIDFYETSPDLHTQTSLRLTEQAREEIEEAHYLKANHTLNQALTIDPNNPFAFYFLAVVYHDQKFFKKSNGILDKAKQLFSNQPFWKAECYQLSAKNWEKLGESKRAEWHLKKANEIYPN